MLLGAVEWLGVEWIDDKTPVLEQVGTFAGALLAAIVAIAAAIIAAKTANARQENQLAEALERQREQLDHDTKRQEEALAHDRAMRDRDYLRNAVAAALENALQCTEASAKYGVAVKKVESANKEIEASGEDESSAAPGAVMKSVEGLEEILPAYTTAKDVTFEGLTHNVRLRAFLGEGNDLVAKHLKLARAYSAYVEALDVTGKIRTDEELAKVQEKHAAIWPALKGFEEQSRREFSR